MFDVPTGTIMMVDMIKRYYWYPDDIRGELEVHTGTLMIVEVNEGVHIGTLMIVEVSMRYLLVS